MPANRPVCRTCRKALSAKQRSANKLTCFSCQAAAKRRKAAARHEYWVRTTYGLQAGEYALIKDFQGGTCAICKRAAGRTRHLSVDHDHKTGFVRGLLCDPCNGFLAQIRDDHEAALRMAAYIREPPAPLALGRIVKVPRERARR